MRRPPIPVLALLAALAAGCGPATATCPPGAELADPGAYVRGRVATADGADGKPVEAAEVSLTDAAGEPIAGLPRARTDAQGDFLAPRVPPGHSYVVVARYPGEGGKDTTLKTLARPGSDPNAFQDLSPASTILTTALTKDQAGLPGDFDGATYARAVELIDGKLATGARPNLDDPAAVVAWLDSHAAADAALKAALDALRPQVAAGEPRARVETEAAATRDADPLDALKPIY